MSSSVFAVIVNYNSLPFFPICLLALKKQTLKDFRLLVVDNASEDGSSAIVDQLFPEAKLVLNQKNREFPTAANQGIKYALKNGAQYVILLGFDTQPEKRWLVELLKTAKKNPQAGICQSKIFLHPEKKKIQSLGNEIHYLGFGFCSHSHKKEITYASGTAMLIKKAVFEKIGFFNEKMMFYEDLDFCWRAQLAGFKIILSPQSRIYHHYEFARYKKKYYYLERSRLLVLLKNYQIKTLLLISPALIFAEIAIFSYALFSGWFFDKIRAIIFVIKNLPNVWRLRTKTQVLRTVPDRKLASYFVSKFSFSALQENKLFKLGNFFAGFYWRLVKNWL